MQNNDYKEFKGFSLFNEVEDAALRLRNRAVILTNILEYNFFQKKLSLKGAALIIGYVQALPEEQRPAVIKEFERQAAARGFVTNV